MKIKVTGIYVDDQDKAVRFYTELLGFAKKTDFSQGPFRWLTVASPQGAGGHGAAAGAEQQPGNQSVSAGDISTAPARDHVLHRRRQGRPRADQGPRHGVHHAAHRRDRLDHCDAEGHLRQPHSAHPAGTLFTLRRIT
jgi:catechol 2,3-dioxygenase-like lactoylglutathione lyase family enzyme